MSSSPQDGSLPSSEVPFVSGDDDDSSPRQVLTTQKRDNVDGDGGGGVVVRLSDDLAARSIIRHSSSPAAAATATAVQQHQRNNNNSSTTTPTRTLRLTAAEQQQQQERAASSPGGGAALRVSYRPRSNPRTRTPMRYESPLDPNEFRRVSLNDDDDDYETANGLLPEDDGTAEEEGVARRITIRPLAGQPVGTTLRLTGRTEDPRERTSTSRNNKTKSSKSGPGHRKLRRWNNDHFDRLAAEVAGGGGAAPAAAAQALLRARQDAHLYRSVYDPEEHQRSERITRFMQDDNMRRVRDLFYEGELPGRPQATVTSVAAKKDRQNQQPKLWQDRMNRMDPRLRRVAVRACINSYPASKVVETFEEYVIAAFCDDENKTRAQQEEEAAATATLDHDWEVVKGNEEEQPVMDKTPTTTTTKSRWWEDLLLEHPTETSSCSKDSSSSSDEKTILFLFDGEASTTAGFHRLLLHAVCQYHGLIAISKMMDIVPFKNEGQRRHQSTSARALSVRGRIGHEDTRYRLLRDIVQNHDARRRED